MFAGEVVHPLRGRADHLHVIEPQRELEILLVAGQRVKVREGFVDAAMFDVEELLQLLVAELVGAGLGPVAELAGDGEGLRIAAIHLHIHQPGHDLVDLIPQSQRRFAPRGEIIRLGVQVTRAQLVLALAKAGDNLVRVLPEPFVAGAGVHQRTGREVMPHELGATDPARGHPAAIRLGGGRQPCVEAEAVQQPVRLKRQQIRTIELHRVLERPGEQPHVL